MPRKQKNIGYGPQAQKHASRLLEALLAYANDELDDCDYLKIEVNWQSENKLVIGTTVGQLQSLVNRVFKDCKLRSDQIKEALRRYKDFLKILEDHRIRTRGSANWHFTLTLWFGRHEKAANLKRFDEEWERCRQKNKPPIETSEVDILVQLIREKVSDTIQARCGYIRVLDMARPVGLESIYTTVYICESISGRQRYALADFLQQLDPTQLGQILRSRISALEAIERYPQLIIYGKPGSGKTTFLKWLAIKCNAGSYKADLIPVFISAKTFAEAKGQPDLLSCIHKQWSDSQVILTQTESILQQGRALILLDGLDEVRETDYDRVFQEIREFSIQFHRCLFIITCRIAAQELPFEHFTEVEITDFDDRQITAFSTQWFESRNDPAKTVQFLNKLNHDQQIKDLATNPLLLTLLCLVFQDSADFAASRADLYREGVEILLKTWDGKRHIKRDGLYRKLSLQCKEALLSEIAFITFELGDYFFKCQTIEQYISNFLCALPSLNDDLEPLEIDSKAVLKSIEAQHGLLVERARGVYSFSHLTFHEYFTAKKISNTPKSQLEEAIKALANHVIHREWREIFLLTASMLQSVDYLLLTMKAKIDSILSDEKSQEFLTWLNGKAKSVTSDFKPAIVRSHFAHLVTNRPLARAIVRNMSDDPASKIARANYFDTSSDLTGVRINLITSDFSDTIRNHNNVSATIEMAKDIANIVADNISNPHILSKANAIATTIQKVIDRAIELSSDPELYRSLQEIRNQPPDPNGDPQVITEWWKDNGHTWVQQLRHIQLRFRNLVYDWQFTESQIILLDQYYEANLLLICCLNSLKDDRDVSPTVRDEIETTLLLSIEDIEQYKKLRAQA